MGKDGFRARSAAGLFVACLMGGAAPGIAVAQTNSIFPSGWDSSVRERLFMRLGYTTILTKTSSESARDITGPVVSRQQLVDATDKGRQISRDCTRGRPSCEEYFNDNSDGSTYAFTKRLLTQELDALGLPGLGTPAGIKAKAQEQVGTPTVSIGYWLDDDRKWLLEGFVLAAPLSVKVYGDGVREDGSPNGVNGRHLVTTKLLPPLVIGSYHFGDRSNLIRPYLGLGATYAVFYGARATSFLDEYQGGKTTVTIKNTWGVGPFVGFASPINDSWHVNVSVGQIRLEASAKLVTSGTQIQSGAAVLQDYPSSIVEQINFGEGLWKRDNPTKTNGLTTTVTDLVKRNLGEDDLGTFVREQKMQLTNTIVTVSVGRSF
jgi:outer membrane protein